jgi:hypothetical protein
MRVGLEREYGQKCVISYHVYMYVVSALDFGWFGFNVLVFFK